MEITPELVKTVTQQWYAYGKQMSKLIDAMEQFARQNHDIASIMDFGLCCVIVSRDISQEGDVVTPDLTSVQCSRRTAREMMKVVKEMLEDDD